MPTNQRDSFATVYMHMQPNWKWSRTGHTPPIVGLAMQFCPPAESRPINDDLLFQFEDFHNYAVRATIKSIARLERCVFLFNNITLWVQCMVLGQHTPQERAGVITKYIKIAQVSSSEIVSVNIILTKLSTPGNSYVTVIVAHASSSSYV